ncbi:MAG: hypothetical protein SOR65_08175 [Odoribacter sp.]|nr:hypothetical protein [Odoribacter sp.]
MKKNIVLVAFVLICQFLAGVFYSCNIDESQYLLQESLMTKGGFDGDSCLADGKPVLREYWESRLKKFPEVKNAMQQLIADDEEFLWNYIESSHSGWIGSYFAIPIAKENMGKINSCVIVPVKPYNEEEYGLCGILENPFILDAEKLNSIPLEFRYLFSLLFLQWEEKGLDIELPLAEFARELKNNYIPFDKPAIVRTKAVNLSKYCTVRYIVDYRITEHAYIEDEEIYVDQVTMDALRTIFRDAAYVLLCYDDLVSYKICDVSPLEIVVELKDDVNARNIIEGYMLLVKYYVHERLYCREIFYQYHVCIHPTWNDISSGNSGSGGGVGGGGSLSDGNSLESSTMPIVNAEGLYDNSYIHNVFQDFARKSSVFNIMLQKFMHERSVVHLKWQYSDTLSSDIAGMLLDTLADYNLIILLNEQLLKHHPPLCVAKTMIHELIHADILLKMLSLEKSRPANMGTGEFENLKLALKKQHYPTLYYYYNEYLYSATSQHAYMSDYWVDIIKTALKQFKPEVDEKICEAVAWQGLKFMQVYDKDSGKNYQKPTPGWERLGEQKQKEIDDIFRDYLRQN